MGKIVVVNHISLDGVMQAPATTDEDRRGGFEHGGWAAQNADDVMAQELGKGMGGPGAQLFGRWSYESLRDAWAERTDGNPFTEAFSRSEKYVVSSTLQEPLPWQNSTLLHGDATEAVGDVKAEVDGTITVLGSQNLLQTLIPAGLIDEYVLLIDPLVLGSGKRLFPDEGTYAKLELVNSVTTTTGVVIGRYETRRDDS